MIKKNRRIGSRISIAMGASPSYLPVNPGFCDLAWREQQANRPGGGMLSAIRRTLQKLRFCLRIPHTIIIPKRMGTTCRSVGELSLGIPYYSHTDGT
jgi:hypothetical protein